jgi:uncharacterized SAM-dependent methyltransferase
MLFTGVSIAAGERVLVEVSRKFTPERLAGLAYKSGLYIQVRDCSDGVLSHDMT